MTLNQAQYCLVADLKLVIFLWFYLRQLGFGYLYIKLAIADG